MDPHLQSVMHFRHLSQGERYLFTSHLLDAFLGHGFTLDHLTLPHSLLGEKFLDQRLFFLLFSLIHCLQHRLLSDFDPFLVLGQLSELLPLVVGVVLIEVFNQQCKLIQVLLCSFVLPHIQKLPEPHLQAIYRLKEVLPTHD